MQNKCKISKCAKYTQGNVDSLANWLIHQLQTKAMSDVLKVLIKEMQKMQNKIKISNYAKYSQGSVDFLANWLIHQLQKKAKSDVV